MDNEHHYKNGIFFARAILVGCISLLGVFTEESKMVNGYIITFRKLKKNCEWKSYVSGKSLGSTIQICCHPIGKKYKCSEKLCPILKTCEPEFAMYGQK